MTDYYNKYLNCKKKYIDLKGGYILNDYTPSTNIGSLCNQQKITKNICDDILKRSRIISVEGNIGTGKSTALEILKANLEGDTIIYEPVDEWIKPFNYDNSKNWLSLMYTEPFKNTFSFQMKAIKSYYDCIITPYNEKSNILIERTPKTSVDIFSKRALDMGHLQLNEYDLIREYYDLIGFESDIVIYLRADPTTSFSRVKERAREAETGLELKFLEDLHERHDKVFNYDDGIISESKGYGKKKISNKSIYYIDSNNDKNIVSSNIKKVLQDINSENNSFTLKRD